MISSKSRQKTKQRGCNTGQTGGEKRALNDFLPLTSIAVQTVFEDDTECPNAFNSWQSGHCQKI